MPKGKLYIKYNSSVSKAMSVLYNQVDYTRIYFYIFLHIKYYFLSEKVECNMNTGCTYTHTIKHTTEILALQVL